MTLGCLLDKLRLFEKPGDKYWDLVVSDKTENGCFSPDSVLEIVQDENNQNTTMGLDISYFLNNNKHIELRNFLFRLNKYQDKFVYLSRVPYLEKEVFSSIKSILSDVINIKDIIVPPPSDIVLLVFLTARLMVGGYSIDNKAIELFSDKIRKA